MPTYEVTLPLEEGKQTKYFAIRKEDIYNKTPNGGVMQLNLIEFAEGTKVTGRVANLEILFFMPPKSTIDFDISLDKESYSPGDKVKLSLSSEETGSLFTSVKVFDITGMLKVPQYKQSPSLPSMVFLEREQYQLEITPGEFQLSNEYVEHWFETEKSNGYFETKGEEYYNLYTSLLLGV